MIEVAVYRTLIKKNDVKIFTLIISEINKMLSSIKDSAKLNEMISVMSLKKLKKKLSIVYHDFLNVFDREKTIQLLLHRSYDHKIELEDESQSSRSWLYFMSSHKLQKIKKYLEENLKNKFITLSKASFASSILFVEKKDDSLRFCMNYRKLNALIKRNHYSILLIDEVLARIQDSKYLTRFNIIITFNKLRMSTESENLITFVTFFDVYKYRVMLFELINESTFFQHYINDVLFNCLHKFCQIYLNDILIYSKILKKHKTHVKKMLDKLREVDLQINIDKCEFEIQKISFLELLIFINDLRMNSRKVDVIRSWKVPRSLTHVQIFIDFCNFYQWFIKNFSKIAQSMIKLIWKDHSFEWTEICQTIFEKLKQQMTTVFILKHFDSIREAILKTNFSNYVNDEVLSQYDDEDILHSVIFYSKNMISAECNYEIYDKKLLTIIRCLKHWRLELKCTDILIKIFIDHLNLKYFMIIKKLIRRQTKWAEKLFEYNFKIIYQSEKQNLKAETLIRMSDVKSVESNNDWKLYQHQMLLSASTFELQSIKDDQDLTYILLIFDSDLKQKSKANENLIEEMIFIQNRIIVENWINQQCINIRTVIEQNRRTCQDMSLDNCRVLNEVLWKNDRLWVSQSMITQLIRKAHDLSINDRSDMNWTLNLLRWSYCWLKMRTTIKCYIRNCYVCRRSKASRDQINELLKSLSISEQRWQDISLNFIIDLLKNDESNAILTVIDRLSKKHHYILCWSDDKETFAEQTVKLLLIWVFRTHELSMSIMFDRGSQFISIVWKSLCLRLNIKMKLFIDYHSQIDDQTKRANQNVERYLRSYCSYMQDDWFIWLSMTEFVDNNAILSSIKQSAFFLYKSFHSHMSFDSNSTEYEITRARIQANKAENIFEHMKWSLALIKQTLARVRVTMKKQIDKHRKKMIYKMSDMMFLNSRNITIARSSKKLNDKMLESFKILTEIEHAYWLKLSLTMKIHSEFISNLLRLNLKDSLEEQRNESSDSIVIDDEDEWKVKNILNFRHYERDKWLQYRVNWKDYDVDLHWYNVNENEFEDCLKIINDFH